jgi:prepilin-type N-terminal cleavage/methylation domain-containing protein
MSRRKQGFTIAELLVVVAIIGVLVAVSIPIFTGQLRKARVATNKANIRSAKAAAIAQYYDDLSAGKFSKCKFTYYKYDTSSGKITIPNYAYKGTYDKSDGMQAYKTALGYGVCSYIMIYVTPNFSTSEAEIQTAPYYTDESGDLPAFTYNTHNNENYYGPDPGGRKSNP